TDALRVRRRGSSAPGAASSRFGTVPDIVDESLPFLRHSRLTEADPAVPALDEVLEAIGPATAVGAVGPAGARGRGVIGVVLGARLLGHLSVELVVVSAVVNVGLPCHEHTAIPARAFDDGPPVAVRAAAQPSLFARLSVLVGLLPGPRHFV